SSSIDGNCVAGQPSNSLGADTEFGSSSSSSINGSCCTSAAVATEVTPPSPSAAASTASSDSSLVDNDSISSLLGGAMLASSTLSLRANSAESNEHYSLEHRSEDGSGTGVRSGDSNNRPDSSPVGTPGEPFAQQPDITLP
ncbi:unnamed protein product, partial [Laminaria digitata]